MDPYWTDDGDGSWEGGAESLRAELALLVPLLAPGTGVR